MNRVLRLDDVDLAELATWVDSRDYSAAYLDPATGEVYQAFEGEVLGTDGEPVDLDDVDWRPIGGSSSRAAYQDMEEFADAVGDPAVARQLWSALGGKGAFRRFRDQIYRQPEEIGRAFGSGTASCAHRFARWSGSRTSSSWSRRKPAPARTTWRRRRDRHSI